MLLQAHLLRFDQSLRHLLSEDNMVAIKLSGNSAVRLRGPAPVHLCAFLRPVVRALLAILHQAGFEHGTPE